MGWGEGCLYCTRFTFQGKGYPCFLLEFHETLHVSFLKPTYHLASLDFDLPAVGRLDKLPQLLGHCGLHVHISNLTGGCKFITAGIRTGARGTEAGVFVGGKVLANRDGKCAACKNSVNSVMMNGGSGGWLSRCTLSGRL